jgi:hypothetical protein
MSPVVPFLSPVGTSLSVKLLSSPPIHFSSFYLDDQSKRKRRVCFVCGDVVRDVAAVSYRPSVFYYLFNNKEKKIKE